MFKKTKLEETTDCETLYMELAYRDDEREEKTMVSIGVLPHDSSGENGTISFQIITFKKGWGCEVSSANLTEAEIDYVIAGLVNARDRMSKNNLP